MIQTKILSKPEKNEKKKFSRSSKNSAKEIQKQKAPERHKVVNIFKWIEKRNRIADKEENGLLNKRKNIKN